MPALMRVKARPARPGHDAGMTPSHIAKFKTALLAKRNIFIDQLTVLRGGAVGRAEASADHFGQKQDSTAQEASAREIEFALDEHETASLALIDAALQRVAAGTYGRCVACSEPIPEARLLALPEAPRCLACQQKLE